MIYNSMGSLVRNTSKSMRDQIEIVRPSYDVVLSLQRSSSSHRRAFTGVQKVIMVYGELKCSTKVVKETSGKDAVLVYRNGKGNVVM